MSELEKLSGGRKPGRPVIESQDENRLYGDIWLMEQIADATGIREDLTKVFDGNKEMVNAILTLAYFPMSGRGTYDHLAAWMRIAKTPYGGELSSPSITILTRSITEQNRMDLFRCRAKRLGNATAGEELTPNTTDGAYEKHVPVIEHYTDSVPVKVSSVEHPSLLAHYIQWIFLETATGYQKVDLKPGYRFL